LRLQQYKIKYQSQYGGYQENQTSTVAMVFYSKKE